jgi:hypothetical protein
MYAVVQYSIGESLFTTIEENNSQKRRNVHAVMI